MSTPASAVGSTVAHYRIVAKLGEGGMGVVYRAEDTKLLRAVALKLLPAATAEDAERVRRLQNEARAAAALTHPNIAAVYELGESGGYPYISLEYVPGQTLRAWMGEDPADRSRGLKLACSMARALAYAHARGIVHRDFKPENVMVTPEQDCKVLDFGLARMETGGGDSTQSLTAEGHIAGTVAYMSPEQLRGEKLDFRSDVFAFGIVLYELVSGKHPFKAASSASTIANILTLEPAPVPADAPVSPPELDRIVRKCLRKDRGQRYQSTQDLVVDLEALVEQKPSGTSATVVPVELRRIARKIAGIQSVYLVASAMSLILFGHILNKLPAPDSALKTFPDEAWAALLVSIGVQVASCVVSCATALSMWRAERASLVSFRKWFLLYLFLDLVPSFYIFLLTVMLVQIGVALLAFALLVYLPFYQRRLAIQALAMDPGAAESRR